jgi:hypothetical protein
MFQFYKLLPEVELLIDRVVDSLTDAQFRSYYILQIVTLATREFPVPQYSPLCLHASRPRWSHVSREYSESPPQRYLARAPQTRRDFFFRRDFLREVCFDRCN